jgi:site-specific recombinase XerC
MENSTTSRSRRARWRRSSRSWGTVFRYGKRIGLMRDNPAADVKKPRAIKKGVYTLDVEEIVRLRAALDVPASGC